ncbi:hypothetical protein CEXT_50661 [Caerostris extrusa]|uniref:Uncharacterized protein n=1 Tax=Caerostris extrusa TaxID=172846 RepID=A0AAV4UQD0_CAEEX|nr:hypothetical protein CEXT_50661 [Caerostris extrusa]
MTCLQHFFVIQGDEDQECTGEKRCLKGGPSATQAVALTTIQMNRTGCAKGISSTFRADYGLKWIHRLHTYYQRDISVNWLVNQ